MDEKQNSVARLLRPLSSLTLTVVLLALSMVLIFAGTTVQTELGIWDVQHRYFHSWFCMLEWRLLFPLWEWGSKSMPGAIIFPGGYTLIALLLVNLISAHAIRFKVNAKRSGILLIHAGMILLLVGEIVTAEKAVESQMVIDQGSSANWSQDIREIELAITDRSPADHDVEVIVPSPKIREGQVIQDAAIPFSVRLDRYYPNSNVAGPMQTEIKVDNPATAGVGKELKVYRTELSKGTDSGVNMPSAYATVTQANGQNLGTYLLSTMELDPRFPQIHQPQVIDIDGKTYWMHLRFKREYKPYTMHLIKFSHDKYMGTDTPKNFSSLVRLVDPANNVDREVLIWMNHPLRYAGETFYQASFKTGDQTTILQVVRNPGWLLPYISCSMVGLGMLIHFGIHLMSFLSRRFAEKAAAGPRQHPVPDSGEPELAVFAKGNGAAAHGAAVLERKPRKAKLQPDTLPLTQPRGKAAWMPAAIITGVLAIYLIALLTPAKSSSSYDMDAFARIPVTYEGRTMPLDSLARNSLRILSGRSEVSLDSGAKLPAIQWMLDIMVRADGAADYKTFRVDHPEVKSLLGLADTRKMFSIKEVSQNFEKLSEQYSRLPAPKERDAYQRQIYTLGQRLLRFQELSDSMGKLFLSPPLVHAEWRQLGPVMQEVTKDGTRDPGAESFVGMLEAYHDKNSTEFNGIASAYASLLDQKLPAVANKLDVEVRFNNADPFIQCMVLYAIVFVLAAGSWMVWHGPLSRAALWVLILALIWHTAALIARIYLQGRPPVTNLYSSAVFIAWAAVAFCVAMEFVYRNGVASAAAAALAFPSLLVAHYLAGDGDTMKMLQAVLDTNIWLATHVVVVSLGYTATFLAGFLAIGYVLGGLFSSRFSADSRKNLYRMVYGVVCFAMLFSFVGTILGGIWADQSWGRFWGWDPKENGAVLVVLWNAIILHARWGGLVRERGVMLLAVGGNIVTAWSWFGTNMLGIGLHAYGFMDSALFWLLTFVGSQLFVIGIGLIPQHLWRSHRASTTQRA